ncbi:hypothetical protein [Paraburkholderia rhizosphaerae]|uniref:hypothetical protein n=1 Tax=Paraburkholderia rhizosphaerae TaxID=480658 RepID=UPI001065CD77|nr:hypothetical protein [Paraburkholderia rhizosphaerae]
MLLAGCGGGGDSGTASTGSSGSGSGTAGTGGSGSNPVPEKRASVSGKVTYDYVPTAFGTTAEGVRSARLDYAKTEKRAVRRARVEVVSEDGKSVIGTGMTDDAGAYAIDLPAGVRVYIRVMSQVSDGPADTPDYLVRVRDNTAPEFKTSPASAPLYAMRGSVILTKAGGTQIDMNAGSGWTGSGYGAVRAAAPFAILDQIVTASQKLHRAAPAVKLPALDVFWSPRNRPAQGDVADGLIQTSHYMPDAAKKGIYLLGAQNVDTDEYDASVIVHEYGHYLEANVSRSDSVGGLHSIGNALDMRVAFGEAWGNAFSSMVRDTPDYADTQGPLQAGAGLVMKLDELEKGATPGWFDESAVGRFLYSLYVSPDIGFHAIYQTMIDGQKRTPALTSVFSFATALRAGLSDAGKAKLDALLDDMRVQAGPQLDAWGTQTRFYDPALINPAIFPVYVPIKPGASATSCTTTQLGVGNKLGNYGHLRITVPTAGKYEIAVTPPPGVDMSDVGTRVFAYGNELPDLLGAKGRRVTEFPAAGDYVADVALSANLDEAGTPGAAPQCVGVSMQAVSQ